MLLHEWCYLSTGWDPRCEIQKSAAAAPYVCNCASSRTEHLKQRHTLNPQSSALNHTGTLNTRMKAQ